MSSTVFRARSLAPGSKKRFDPAKNPLLTDFPKTLEELEEKLSNALNAIVKEETEEEEEEENEHLANHKLLCMYMLLMLPHRTAFEFECANAIDTNFEG